MERTHGVKSLSFGARAGLALKLLFNGEFASEVAQGLDAKEAKAPTPDPARLHASALSLLNSLQREGRLVDFLQQDVTGFSDEQVGAAARVVHGGCRKVLQLHFELGPVTKEEEGAEVTVPKGFDAQRWRLTGNVTGQPPFRGTLRHHGWVALQVRMPAVSDALDPRVVAPAEVELP